MTYSIDSRTIQPGDTFIPVKGPNFDGHDFIDDVIKKGGKVLDVDLFEYAKKYRKKLKCKVIAITGSSGKTTVKDMLAAILGQKFKVTKTHENQNNEFGVPLTLLSADANTEYLIVEMGMRKKGDISFLTKIVQPDIVVVTNIGLTHIEFFTSQRQLCLGKAEIFRKAQKWQEQKRVSFINFNTPYHNLLVTKAEKNGYIALPFKGEDKLSENINLCYAVGQHLGLDAATINNGIETVETSSKRLKVLRTSTIRIIDDSYNSNPAGLEYAFTYLKKFKGRKIVVLGAMLELGKYSKKEHQKVEQLALNHDIDLCITLGEEFKVLNSKKLSIIHFESKKALHEYLKVECKFGDVILVKGSRGLKMEETVEFLRTIFL
tara:strand:- start:12923 stop:14050 length:1128 start_codon:yes stop_codon:yes gene_type:complete